MAASIGSDTSIVEHDYTKSHLPSGSSAHQHDPRICYINSSEDLHCLHSSSGGSIRRILRSTEKVEVPTKCGILIPTQVFHPGNPEKWYVTNALMTSSIEPLGDYWLGRECEAQIIVDMYKKSKINE